VRNDWDDDRLLGASAAPGADGLVSRSPLVVHRDGQNRFPWHNSMARWRSSLRSPTRTGFAM